jgi:regulator of cell morphogenesis and NO signaling
MPHHIAQRASVLIELIQTRFHEGHRGALPELLAMADAVEARGTAKNVVDAVKSMGDALELHMFKEEMRLFPMMEQGGNTLIARLIDDLHREHVEHGDAMLNLRARLASLRNLHGSDPALTTLVLAVDRFADELTQHIRTEDDVLFPLFLQPGVRACTPSPAHALSKEANA